MLVQSRTPDARHCKNKTARTHPEQCNGTCLYPAIRIQQQIRRLQVAVERRDWLTSVEVGHALRSIIEDHVARAEGGDAALAVDACTMQKLPHVAPREELRDHLARHGMCR